MQDIPARCMNNPRKECRSHCSTAAAGLRRGRLHGTAGLPTLTERAGILLLRCCSSLSWELLLLVPRGRQLLEEFRGVVVRLCWH
jgi:hypothetical protein